MAWTTPKTWTAAEVVTAANMNAHVRDNLKALTEWTAYTPTWTGTGGTPAIGNGTLTGAYIKAGNLCHFWFRLAFGTTTAHNNSTAWTFGLPFATAVGTYFTFPVQALDAGLTLYQGMATAGNGATGFAPVGNGTGIPWGYNNPIGAGFGNLDTITAAGTYQC